MSRPPPTCGPAAPHPSTHMREEREVQVPPQMAHGAPAPVLEHVQVHLPLVYWGWEEGLPSAQLPPALPKAEPLSRAHLLPPRGRLTGEVERQWPSSPPGKQRIWVPTFGLRERRGTRVKAEEREGRKKPHSHTHAHQTQRATQPATPAGSLHRDPFHVQPRSPDSITPRPCTPTRADPWPPHMHQMRPPRLGPRSVVEHSVLLCPHGLQVLRPPAQDWPWVSCVLWCSSPQPCSPPAPPHGSRWSPLPSVWTVQPGCPGHLSHRSASHHL